MVDNGLDGKQLTYQVLIYESLWLVHKSNRENILHTTRTVNDSASWYDELYTYPIRTNHYA